LLSPIEASQAGRDAVHPACSLPIASFSRC